MRILFACLLIAFCGTPGAGSAKPIKIARIERSEPIEFEKDILPILRKNCLACHNATDKQGNLVLEAPEGILEGGDSGPAVVSEKSGESLLLKLASRRAKPHMPPPDNDVEAKPLSPNELGLIQLWIDQGAQGPSAGLTLSPKNWRSLPSGVQPVYAVAIAPDGQYVACSRANQIALYHVPTGKLVAKLVDPMLADRGLLDANLDQEGGRGVAHADLVNSLAFNLEGDLLASGGFREIKLWRRPRDVQKLNLALASPATAAAISPDGTSLAITDLDHSIRLFKADTGEAGLALSGHTDVITAIDFTADGKRLLSASLDGSIRVWQLNDGSAVGRIETPGPVNDIELVRSVAADDKMPDPPEVVVSGGPDNLLRLWTIPETAPAVPDTSLPNVQSLARDESSGLLAFLTADGTLRVLQTGSDKEIATWKPGEGQITALAFVPAPAARQGDPQDGPLPQLATASSDGALRLWSLPGHELLGQWKGAASVRSLACAADGATLASGGENGQITLWNVSQSLTPWEEPVGAPATVVVASPSRRLVAVAAELQGKPVVVIRESATGRVVNRLPDFDGVIRAIAISPDDTTITTAGDDAIIRIWDLAKPQDPPRHQLAGHTARVTSLAFSADGTQLVSGGADAMPRLWDAANGALVKEFAGHTAAVVAVGFAPGNQPFSAALDQTVRFWNPADASQIRAWSVPAVISAVSLSPDGQKMAVAAEDKLVRLFQTLDGQLLYTLTGHTVGVPTSIGFSQDATRLVSAATGGEIVFWDTVAGVMLESAVDPALASASFMDSAERVLTTDRDGRFAWRAMCFVRRLEGSQQAITSLEFHANGQTLYSTSLDGTLRGYVVANAQQAFAVNHGGPINALAVSADGQILATAGENGQVRLWQPGGGGFGPQQLQAFTGPAKSLAFSADGKKLLVGGRDEKPAIKVFDVQSAVLEQRFAEHTQDVAGIAFVPASGAYSASADGLRRWTVHAVRTIPGHTAAITSLAHLPASPGQIWSGSMDTTVRLWQLESGQQLQQFNHSGAVTAIAANPDGTRIAAASDNNTARLWNINGQQIAEMRGDVRKKTAALRLAQLQNAAATRAAILKQQFDAAQQDLPIKTDAKKRATETLAAANAAVAEKQGAFDAAAAQSTAAEKAAIEASAASKQALAARKDAQKLAADAARDVERAQQKANRLSSAASAAPADEALQKAAEEARQALAGAQAKSQAATAAQDAPTLAAQQAAQAADAAAARVTELQPPYNAAVSALVQAKAAQDLASQQQVVAVRELESAKALVPLAQESLTQAEARQQEAARLLETANLDLQAAEQPLRAIAFSPDGKLLATGGAFPAVHTWDAETGMSVGSFVGHTNEVRVVRFAGNGTILTAGADQTARLWEVNPQWVLERSIGSLDDPGLLAHRVTTLDFSSDGRLLLAGGGIPSRNGELFVFEVATGAKVLSLPTAHDDVVYAARFSPDGRRIASGGADKYLRTFDVASASQLRRFEGHTHYVLGVAWKGDGQTLVTASADKTVKSWNAETGDQIVTIGNFNKQISAVRFIGETDNIASSSGDGVVRLHNAANGGNFLNLDAAKGWLHCVDITADSQVVAAGAADGTVFIWNGTNAQLLHTLKP